MNLRGVRESGSAFAIPIYGFILSIFGMVAYALRPHRRRATCCRPRAPSWTVVAEGTFTGLALVFLVARAFSCGTTALTGIEAISNGVPAFRKPKSKNAATTLLLLGVIATSMFASSPGSRSTPA